MKAKSNENLVGDCLRLDYDFIMICEHRDVIRERTRRSCPKAQRQERGKYIFAIIPCRVFDFLSFLSLIK